MTEHRGPLFWISALAGWALVAWGLHGVLHHHIDTRPHELARFFLGGVVAHDLLFAPFVLLVGVLIAQAVPASWRAAAQAVLIISGCAALFAWPEVRDYARVNHNPSSLPHNYTANLLIVVVAVCAGVAVVAAIGARRHRA